MTTAEMSSLNMREYLAIRLSRYAHYKRRERELTSRTNGTVVLYATVRVMLHLAGFALLTLAAFQVNMLAGLAVAGVSCFVLSTLLTGQRSTAVNEMEVRRAPDLRTGR